MDILVVGEQARIGRLLLEQLPPGSVRSGSAPTQDELSTLGSALDLTPLWWIAGGLTAAFVGCVVFLMPFALGEGARGRHARTMLREFFALVHGLIEVAAVRAANRRPRRRRAGNSGGGEAGR